MQLLAVELRRCELQLVHRLASSRSDHAARPVLLVRVETDIGHGWGECAALASPTYTEEYADGAEKLLAEVLAPMLLSVRDPFGGAADARQRLDAVRGNHMAKAALEMALLDAELRAAGRSLANFLGATETHVRAGATVGVGEPDEVLEAVAEAVAAGFTRVKCKIGPGRDVVQLRTVRDAFSRLDLAADANGSYRLDDPEDNVALHQIDELGLVALEQPLSAGDLVGHAALASWLATPLVLDESITDIGTLEAAIALRSCDAVSVKAGRLGGLAAAVRVQRRCREAGLALTAGGMFETGIGRAAALALAALPGFDLPGDLGPSDRYFVSDLTAPHVLVDGTIAVPTGPGLGVEPLLANVDATTVRSTTIGDR